MTVEPAVGDLLDRAAAGPAAPVRRMPWLKTERIARVVRRVEEEHLPGHQPDRAGSVRGIGGRYLQLVAKGVGHPIDNERVTAETRVAQEGDHVGIAHDDPRGKKRVTPDRIAVRTARDKAGKG